MKSLRISFRRRLRGPLLLGTVVCTAVTLLPSGAGAAPARPQHGSHHQARGAVTGVVLTSFGMPGGRQCVSAHRIGSRSVQHAVSSAQGRFRLGHLQAGRYALTATACAGAKHARGRTSGPARMIRVRPGRVVRKAEVFLAPMSARATRAVMREQIVRADTPTSPGSITGTVTSGGNPVANICADAEGGSGFGLAMTDQNGQYSIANLPAGIYRVQFYPASYCGTSGNYVSQYYSNATDFYSSLPVRVYAGAITSAIDDNLAVGGVITGTVTDSGGNPLEGVCVEAYGSYSSNLSHDTTGADGTYTLEGLATGAYHIYFDPTCTGDNYVQQYYDNTPDYYAAMPVSVTEGGTVSNINDTLADGGTITGTVTSLSGAPLSGICVEAEGNLDQVDVSTVSDGTYTIVGLPAGSYRVLFTAQDCGDAGNYADQYYDDVTEDYSFTPVTVTEGGAANNINAALAPETPNPVADFNGDGTTDVSIYRPSTGQWFIKGQSVTPYGKSGDIPVPGDYNGDGTTDIAVFRPSTGQWFINGQGIVQYGKSGDIPVPGDYNGDGTTDVAIYRPSTNQWFVQGRSPVTFGQSGDIPVPGDYNGDGATQMALYRPSTGQWLVYGQSAVQVGKSGDIPVPGDYDGDGVTDMAVFRPSIGQWLIPGQPTVQYGNAGDVPVPGDYNNDGMTDVAIYRPSTGQWYVDLPGQSSTPVQYGSSTDEPLPLPYAIYHGSGLG